MTALDWTLFAMFMVALLIAWIESRRKYEYWKLWVEQIDYAASLERKLAEYEKDKEDT